MNINRLINSYFLCQEPAPIIEVFDKDTIYSTYKDIVSVLSNNPNIELSILQGLSYCFYELLDNVLTHSKKECGTVLLQYQVSSNRIQILVADDGIGIRKSLSENPIYKDITEKEALLLCIKDNVTDGKGMGFGLYSTARLIKNVGIRLVIHSGHSMMTYDGQEMRTEQVDFWQGTLVYFELHANREIDPNEVVDNRMDCAGQFNDMFLEDDDIDELW